MKATVKGGPLDGQEVECNGDTYHVPVTEVGKPTRMFIYKLWKRRYSDGRSKFFLLPLGATDDWDEVGK